MKLRTLSLTTFNLYNLNEPGVALYQGSAPWTEEQYAAKIAWASQMLRSMRADVYGFQELWHRDSLVALLEAAGLAQTHVPLVPQDHDGKKIVCAGAVRADILVGEPEWIEAFPEDFRLQSGGDDPQTAPILVNLKTFSRPVLHFTIRPRDDSELIHIYVCHFKSKAPTKVFRESWFEADEATYKKHQTNIGSALSTIRRTAEASALRFLLTEQMKGTSTPVVVLGDVNDGHESNTVNILTTQPRYLMGFSTGGGDDALYVGQTLQEYRSTRDVYYTHVHQNIRESLDQILFSQEFYDNSKRRVWAFAGLEIANDHLNFDDHKASGTGDHGIVRVTFTYDPADSA